MNPAEFQPLQKVVRLGERFVSYAEYGHGDPVMLIHGIPTWGYLWHGLIDSLAERHRFIVPDLLGFGYSDKSDCFDRSIGRQAAMIDALMEQIGVLPAAVVGHDIGGGVALRLATLFAQRVSRLCVMNCVCYDSWPIELMLQFGHPETNRKLSADTAVTMHKHALRWDSRVRPNRASSRRCSGLTNRGGKAIAHPQCRRARHKPHDRNYALLAGVRVPTLVLWGEDDKFQLVKYGERLASDIPDSKLVRIRGARHLVMFDKPDEVAHELSASLQGIAASLDRPAEHVQQLRQAIAMASLSSRPPMAQSGELHVTAN